jgi:hypothetical protein
MKDSKALMKETKKKDEEEAKAEFDRNCNEHNAKAKAQ